MSCEEVCPVYLYYRRCYSPVIIDSSLLAANHQPTICSYNSLLRWDDTNDFVTRHIEANEKMNRVDLGL